MKAKTAKTTGEQAGHWQCVGGADIRCGRGLRALVRTQFPKASVQKCCQAQPHRSHDPQPFLFWRSGAPSQEGEAP